MTKNMENGKKLPLFQDFICLAPDDLKIKYPYLLKIDIRNISLAAKGALAHRLQRRTPLSFSFGVIFLEGLFWAHANDVSSSVRE